MIDTSGKPVTSARLERSLRISLIAGGMGSVWFILCQPQQILTVFIRNYLNATDLQLGNFVAFLNLAGVFHLGAIILYSWTSRIKRAWIAFNIVARSSAFFIAGAAFYVHRGGDTRTALWTVMASSFFFSFLLGNISGSGWWTWISTLTPEKIRAAYFGKRSSLAQLMNIIFFFSATWLLDHFSMNVFLVYGWIYLAAGIMGEMDIILHGLVPEPSDAHVREGFRMKRFTEPVRNRNFLRFGLITGLSVLSINIAVPFQAPYITSPETIGAPNIWLGIMFLISQLTWMILVPFWGMVMDRMGKKPVVLLGLLFPLSFPLYLALTPHNYMLLLPGISLWAGLFAPAFWEEINQMMLVLAPADNRTPYIAWYWALMGMVGSLGPLLGGLIMKTTGSLGVTTLAAMIMLAVSFIIFSTVRTPADSSLENVVALITTPSAYRTFYQLPVLSGTTRPDKVEKALRDVKSKSGKLAFEEVCSRLDDPNQDVREEAARAMGRIGTAEARDVLTGHLISPDSLVRPEAARALGCLGDHQSIPHLIDALYTGDDEVQEEAARALGRLNCEESVRALKQLIREERSQRVKVSGAQSIASQGRLDAVEEIMNLWVQTTNRVLKNQLTISLGNLIGKPGEFYRCITGTSLNREAAIANLFRDVHKGLRKLEIIDSGHISHIIRESLPAVEDLFTREEYADSILRLNTIILNLVFRRLELMGFAGGGEDVDAFLKEKDPFLYLGYHVVHRLESFRNDAGVPAGSTEILLGVYFLKSYCRRETSRQKKSP